MRKKREREDSDTQQPVATDPPEQKVRTSSGSNDVDDVIPGSTPFALERYFAKFEFSTPNGLLSCSDPESYTMKELLLMASPAMKNQWENLSLGYTESMGHPLLRETISEMYSQPISVENVLTVVPEEGIFLVLSTLLKKGDTMIANWPAYQSLYQVALDQGCSVNKWKWKITENAETQIKQWDLDTSELEGLLTPQTKLVVLNVPHNPTGGSVSREKFLEIIEICRRHDVHLLCDEMYRFLELGPRLSSACEVYEKAIIICGLSKAFALPGLRVGWLVSQNSQAMQALATAKDYTTICGSAPSEILAIIALQNREAILMRNNRIIAENLPILENFFASYSHVFEWIRPAGSTIGLPRLLVGDAQIFCNQLMEEEGIMLLPSSVYEIEGFVRIGFGRRNMPKVLQRLTNFVERHYPAP